MALILRGEQDPRDALFAVAPDDGHHRAARERLELEGPGKVGTSAVLPEGDSRLLQAEDLRELTLRNVCGSAPGTETIRSFEGESSCGIDNEYYSIAQLELDGDSH